jgi:hypothetical protein
MDPLGNFPRTLLFFSLFFRVFLLSFFFFWFFLSFSVFLFSFLLSDFFFCSSILLFFLSSLIIYSLICSFVFSCSSIASLHRAISTTFLSDKPLSIFIQYIYALYIFSNTFVGTVRFRRQWTPYPICQSPRLKWRIR